MKENGNTFIHPAPFEASRFFSKIDIVGTDEIDAHMHFFQLHSEHYITLISETLNHLKL